MCRASNSKQDLRSPGENHSRGFSLHILRHRIIIRALREWTPSPASVLANSALDQRPDNLGGGPCLKSLCPVEVNSNLTSGSGLLNVRIELFIAALTLEELGSKDPT